MAAAAQRPTLLLADADELRRCWALVLQLACNHIAWRAWDISVFQVARLSCEPTCHT